MTGMLTVPPGKTSARSWPGILELKKPRRHRANGTICSLLLNIAVYVMPAIMAIPGLKLTVMAFVPGLNFAGAAVIIAVALGCVIVAVSFVDQR